MFKYDESAKSDMSDIERLDRRLSAVERAVVDGDAEIDRLANLAALAEDLERLDSRVGNHERRLAKLNGAVGSIGGFVGNVESINEDVERRADAAIADVDRLEYRIDELERALTDRGSRDGGRDRDDVNGDRARTTPRAPNEAGVDGRIAGSGRAFGATASGADSTAPVTTEPTADDAPFGAPGDAETTAETLLETPENRGETNNNGSSETSIRGDDESSTLFASLRARLP